MSTPEIADLVQEQRLALRRSLVRIDAHRTALAGILPLDGRRLARLDDAELMRIEALMKKFENALHVSSAALGPLLARIERFIERSALLPDVPG